MSIALDREVIVRDADNPLLTLDDLSFQCIDICNAGVVKRDGQTLLLITVESLAGRTGIVLARSDDGRHFTPDDQPLLIPRFGECGRPCECDGMRDARVTPLDGQYYITYVTEGPCGFRVGMARTGDFRRVERLGLISQPDTKNGVLLPEKIGGRYAMLTRPCPGASIWLEYSDDLTFWRPSGVVMTPRGGYWDSDRIGAACPPIAIEQGWLLLYYGEKITSAGPLMRVGAAVLDRKDPTRVIARSNIPILTPRTRYERIGDIPNIVFSCGAVLEDDGELKLYYGASDSCICMGTARLEDVLQVCRKAGREY
ncbi:MAG: glycoside hydrolase family 130 protein [Phycisphaerae bacterium]